MQASQMERIMDEADAYGHTHSERLSHAQVFGHAREVVIAELNQVDALCANDPRHYTRAPAAPVTQSGAKGRKLTLVQTEFWG